MEQGDAFAREAVFSSREELWTYLESTALHEDIGKVPVVRIEGGEVQYGTNEPILEPDGEGSCLSPFIP